MIRQLTAGALFDAYQNEFSCGTGEETEAKRRVSIGAFEQTFGTLVYHTRLLEQTTDCIYLGRLLIFLFFILCPGYVHA